jgi:hypothetical protein
MTQSGSSPRRRFPVGRSVRSYVAAAPISGSIEKCLAHEDGSSARGVYNKAEYEVQRRHMMQEWSNMIDAWVQGRKYVPVLIPPSMPLLELDPSLSQAESAVA